MLTRAWSTAGGTTGKRSEYTRPEPPFFSKQKTAYEIPKRDWSSDVCSSDLDGGGEILFADAPVSAGKEAQVTDAGEYRFFSGWRSDPFFFDAGGALNEFQFTGDDFFADKDVCSIVLEMPNNALGASGQVAIWHRTLVPNGDGDAGWMQ